MAITEPLTGPPTGPIRDFIDVKKVQGTLLNDLQRLGDYSSQLNLAATQKAVAEAINHLQTDSFTIAVVGEFKRGKSTFINALLGRDVLPTDILPTTATLNRIVYDLQPSVTIAFKDGHSENIDISALSEYVTKLTSSARTRAATISEAIVHYPVPYLRNNVEIIDTPGLNDEASMDVITTSVVPQVDAAILVISATSPFGMYEADFLENKLLASDLGRVIFVVSRIDSLDGPTEADRIVDFVRERVQENILQRSAQLYGADSEEYRAAVRKIGTPRVFGVAGKLALTGKLTNDEAKLSASRFPQFEAALERFLIEERGPIMIQVPLNRVLSSARSVLESISLREHSIQMQREDFEKAYDQSTKQLLDLRRQKTEEMRLIDEARASVASRVRPLIDQLGPDLIAAADAAIAACSISKADIGGDEKIKATNARLSADIANNVKNASRLFADRIQADIQRSLQHESERLRGFAQNVDQVISSVVAQFAPISASTDAQRSGVVEGSLAFVSFMLPGFSGLWTGYRKAGAKGALLGAGTSFGVVFTAGAMLSLLAIPVTLPLVAVIGIAGALTGGKVVEAVLGDTLVKNFRDNYRTSVHQEINRQLQAQGVAAKVNDQINAAFDALKAKFAEEIESVLDNTQNTLIDLRAKRERNEAMTEQEAKELAEMRNMSTQIIANAQRLAEQIVAIESV